MMIDNLSNKFGGIGNHQTMPIDKIMRHEDVNTFFKMLHVKNNGLDRKGTENKGILGDHTILIGMLNHLLTWNTNMPARQRIEYFHFRNIF